MQPLDVFEQLQEAVDYIRQRSKLVPTAGLILGTGLSELASSIESEATIEFHHIPHFPQPTAPGHRGALIIGWLEGCPVVAMAGRLHYYEGYSMHQVVFPVRVMKLLGAQWLIASNAAGSTNPHFEAGDLVFIRDHINLQPENPLRGPNDERLGPRFPDLLETYDPVLISHAKQTAARLGIRAHTGVYASLPGPNLETPAEYEYLHRIGADVVGMSTVPEVLAAKHMGMRIFVVSVVSNKSYPLSAIQPTTVESVIATVNRVSPKVQEVVKELVRYIQAVSKGGTQ
ncbi:MAG: purine nucleoside phosphorylase [Saprospiraceae bacterium]|nr:MAG: purine nucleoside phosphorylase [Saprospiraceae bacterium]